MQTEEDQLLASGGCKLLAQPQQEELKLKFTLSQLSAITVETRAHSEGK